MNRARPLSDEYILSECAAYQSVPMHLNVNENANVNFQPFGVKKMKYDKQVSRPATYDTMSKNLSKLSGPGQEEMVRAKMNKLYNQKLRYNNANLRW